MPSELQQPGRKKRDARLADQSFHRRRWLIAGAVGGVIVLAAGVALGIRALSQHDRPRAVAVESPVAPPTVPVSPVGPPPEAPKLTTPQAPPAPASVERPAAPAAPLPAAAPPRAAVPAAPAAGLPPNGAQANVNA